MHGVPRVEAEHRAAATLVTVGLAGAGHRSVGELSGGEQQRVALARAIAPEPRLLMLDEPLGSLDRPLRERLADELRELFDRLDLSVLLVTHDQDEAFALGDRVAVMHAGRIDQIGAPAEVWRSPATEFVARFLGWNVSDRLDGGRAAVPPDGLRIDPAGPLAGNVVSRTFRRDHFRIRVRLDETAETLEVAVASDDVPPAPGDDVRLALDPRRVRRLPPLPA
jgi:thiamine transport system ATP-binding protein